jgi:hypothetical protein
MKISQRAFDMTVAEEVTSQAYYIKHYQRPEWPGVSSGVTIAIGYDLGQASRAKIAADWGALVDPNMLLIMQSCSGITGNSAKAKCAEVRNKILIPWEAALSVFANRDVPSWTSIVLKAVPGAEKLTPTCLGMLFDTAYNRGAGGFNSSTDRNREMRAIRDDVKTGALNDVPRQFESMKRIWPTVSGLQRRCERRAALWKVGLTERGAAVDVPMAPVGATPAAPDPEVPLNAGPARTKPPATTPAQHTTAGAIVTGGAAAATQAHAAGFSTINVALIVILALVIAAAVWTVWYKNRNPT